MKIQASSFNNLNANKTINSIYFGKKIIPFRPKEDTAKEIQFKIENVIAESKKIRTNAYREYDKASELIELYETQSCLGSHLPIQDNMVWINKGKDIKECRKNSLNGMQYCAEFAKGKPKRIIYMYPNLRSDIYEYDVYGHLSVFTQGETMKYDSKLGTNVLLADKIYMYSPLKGGLTRYREGAQSYNKKIGSKDFIYSNLKYSLNFKEVDKRTAVEASVDETSYWNIKTKTKESSTAKEFFLFDITGQNATLVEQ